MDKDAAKFELLQMSQKPFYYIISKTGFNGLYRINPELYNYDFFDIVLV
jgi:hypothetical protein